MKDWIPFSPIIFPISLSFKFILIYLIYIIILLHFSVLKIFAGFLCLVMKLSDFPSEFPFHLAFIFVEECWILHPQELLWIHITISSPEFYWS